MDDLSKTKTLLLDELRQLRQRLAELEAAASDAAGPPERAVAASSPPRPATEPRQQDLEAEPVASVAADDRLAEDLRRKAAMGRIPMRS